MEKETLFREKMKKILAVSLVLIFAQVCTFAQVFYKSGTFKIVDAQKKTFFPGVMGSPITTTVTFKIVMKTCTKLTIDSFWMDGMSDKVEVLYANHEAFDGKPMKGDTLLINCSYFKLPEEQPVNGPKVSGSPSSEVPMKHKGAVLFRYVLKGKTYYYSILDVKKGENVFAP